MSGRDVRALTALLVLAVGLPLALGVLSGALSIPHNDDWDFRRVALGLYREGRIAPVVAAMALIGQVLAVQPFLWLSGGAPWAFGLMTAAFAAVGVGAAYRLLRRVLDVGPAFTAILMLVLFPGFTVNTTSFMTDVPALAAAFLCLELGAAAMAAAPPGRRRLLIASLVVGCFGISIREFDLAAPVAVLVALAAADRRHLRSYAVAGALVLLFAAVIHIATSGLVGVAGLVLDVKGGLGRLQPSLTTVAFALIPATVLAFAVWRGSVWRRDLIPGLVVGIAIAWGPLMAVITSGKLPGMFIGNIFAEFGTSGGGALSGGRPAVYPSSVWHAVQAFALVATIIVPGVVTGIVGAAIRSGGVGRERLSAWLGSPTGLLAAFAALTAAGLVAYGFLYPMYDRYLWSLIPAVGALLLVRPTRKDAVDGAQQADDEPSRRAMLGAAAISAVLLAGLGALSVLLLLNSNAFGAARWQMGEQAVARGLAAGTVDAGMEWVAYQGTGAATPNGRAKSGSMWYTGLWPRYLACAVVSSSQIPGTKYTLMIGDAAAYRQFQLFGPPLPLYLYKVADPACP